MERTEISSDSEVSAEAPSCKMARLWTTRRWLKSCKLVARSLSWNSRHRPIAGERSLRQGPNLPSPVMFLYSDSTGRLPLDRLHTVSCGRAAILNSNFVLRHYQSTSRRCDNMDERNCCWSIMHDFLSQLSFQAEGGKVLLYISSSSAHAGTKSRAQLCGRKSRAGISGDTR